MSIKHFSYREFMNFSESLVDSLETISAKLDEVTDKVTTLETVLEGDGAADFSGESQLTEDEAAIEAMGGDPNDMMMAGEEDMMVEGGEEVADDEMPEDESEEVSEEEVQEGTEEFSTKYVVVGLKVRPWGNKVIKAKNFSSRIHNKLIPTEFTNFNQAKRALDTYNINGTNFSIRYNNVKNILNM